MRLQTLTIKGFKSFANETVIHFSENVTGVVGPNGSGKSNIVDAFRWVLGEQKSKDLRLDKMSNIIFNGSGKKRESGTAHVSLTFINNKGLLPTEYATVTISRILYRTGESEYRINDVTCRLKDVTSLFIDTGMGSDSYAIIALNMVEELLNDKEQSRQRMLFQAAGITKYKIRKEETLRKLKSTEEDLERLRDVLFEIETNLKSLEKQAKRAEKYLELKKQYKDLALKHIVLQINQIKDEYKILEGRISREELEIGTVSSQLILIEARIEAQKKNFLEAELKLTTQQKAISSVVQTIQTYESDKQVKKNKLDYLNLNGAKLSESLITLRNRKAELLVSIEIYEKELLDAKELELSLKSKLDQAGNYLEACRLQLNEKRSQQGLLLSTIQANEKSLLEYEKQIALQDNVINNAKRELNRTEEQLIKQTDEIIEIEKKLAVVSKAQKEANSTLNDLEKRVELQEKQRNELTNKIDEYTQQLTKINREGDAKRNEYKLILSMVEKLEGFPESVQFLSQNREWSKKVTIVADLLFCKEEYRICIENYLDQYLNYYVAANIEDAVEAVELLKHNQKGRANFFILNELKQETHKKVYIKETGLIPALDCVEAESKYKSILELLLANVYISENSKINNDEDPGLVVLEKNGLWVRKINMLSGGSIGLFEGRKIGRRKNLEALDKQISSLEKESKKIGDLLKTSKNELEEIKKVNLQSQLREIRDNFNKINQEKIGHETRLDNYGKYRTEVKSSQLNYLEQITAAEEKLKNYRQVIDKDNTALNVLKNDLKQKDDTLSSLNEALSLANKDFNENNLSFIRQQNAATTILREIEFRLKQKEVDDGNEKRLIEDQSTEDIERKQLTQDIAKIESELILWYQNRSGGESGLEEAEKAYFQMRQNINELEEEYRNSQKAYTEKQSKINNTKDRFNEVKFKLAAIGERTQLEFKIGINELINLEAEHIEDPENFMKEVDILKLRLEGFGEVNPMAVEAYNEIKQRYEVIKIQEADIFSARDTLALTIKEIEITATRQYLDAFEKVRSNFIDVFRSLFTADDTCDLILTDPDNPLTSDVTIIAKPKGKKPQSINQLSGGEKTLTAIALLFALYLLKPAPFCIFDEVDAPLDDSNIDKFNKIIKKFSSESQFIIVTHNKATMAAVDVIYGVYMPEQGVSGVTEVDFRSLTDSKSIVFV